MKLHQVIYQQGKAFGRVGDRCEYISHEELFALAEDRKILLRDNFYRIIVF